jgi:hypothetical protein
MTTIKYSGHDVEIDDSKPEFNGDVCALRMGEVIHAPKTNTGGGFFEQLEADDGETREPVIIKRQRWTADTDLMLAEKTALTVIRPPNLPDEKFLRYFPKLISFPASYDDLATHVLIRAEGMVTLEEVMTAHPSGLDIRDFAWIFKRILAGIGYAHSVGFVHAALLPPHVLVHPTERGAKIIDWCYSSRLKDKQSIKVIVKRFRDYYPPEVFAKRLPTPALDIYMAAKLGVLLLGGNVVTNELPSAVPSPLARLLRGCLATTASERVQDAWDLHEALDKVMEGLVGKPSYRVLEMP